MSTGDRPRSNPGRPVVRTDLHVHHLGYDDHGKDLGYAVVQEHPGGGGFYEYCAKCVLDAKSGV